MVGEMGKLSWGCCSCVISLSLNSKVSSWNFERGRRGGGDGLGNTGRLVLKKLWVFFVWASTLNMGFINKGWYGMFVACGIWCLADFSSVSPSSASVNLCLSNLYFSGKCLIFKVSLIGFSQLKSSFGFFNWKNVSLWIYMYHSTFWKF